MGKPPTRAPINSRSASRSTRRCIAFGPFERDELVERRATAPTPPATAKVPAWLERIVLRAIALDPERRFATMDELLAALAKDPTAARRRVVLGASDRGRMRWARGRRVRVAEQSGASEPCAPMRPTRLAGVWDARATRGARDRVRKLNKPFARTTRSAAPRRHSTPMRRVGRHAHRGVQGDARPRRSQSEDVLTLRMECLDAAARRARDAGRLFGTADEALVLGAVDRRAQAQLARRLRRRARARSRPIRCRRIRSRAAARDRAAGEARRGARRCTRRDGRRTRSRIVTAIAPEVMRSRASPDGGRRCTS